MFRLLVVKVQKCLLIGVGNIFSVLLFAALVDIVGIAAVALVLRIALVVGVTSVGVVALFVPLKVRLLFN